MSYFVETRWGGSEDAPPPTRLRQILAELDVPDPEHPDTWLTHESGWTLSVYESGLVLFANADGAASHMNSVSRERALELWLILANGRIDELAALQWKGGYPPRDPDAIAQAKADGEALQLKSDQAFYERLGPESSDEICGAQQCDRHRIAYSVYCRRHHFESVRKRPCPFEQPS